MTDLRVDLHGVRIGTLSGERERFDFAAHREGLDRFGIGSSVLSVAVPLLRRPRSNSLDQRRNFFEEVPPCGFALEALLETLGNEFAA